MAKVIRKYQDRTDIFEIPTKVGNRPSLDVTIISNAGTEEAQSLTFPIPTNIAILLVKGLYEGMKIEEQELNTPQYSFEP